MNVSAWAIKNPITILLLFAVLTLVGIFSYRGLGINDWPDVDFPVVLISVAEPGASAGELETDVTRKVEDALVGIPHLDHVRSTIVEGMSTTVAEFAIGANTETALNDVRDAVSRIRQTLPEAINEPQITHPNGAGVPFITYTIASPTRSVGELSRLVDEDLTRSLLTVPGVAQVQRNGGLTREIRVALDPARLAALGTSVEYVNSQLRSLNLNVPGGQSKAGGGEIGIRTLGAAKSIEDLRNTPIPLASGAFVRLGDLGTVTDAFAEQTQIARLDGKPVVGFSVIRSQGAPLVQTERGVRDRIAQLEKALPGDLTFTLVRTNAAYTRASFQASIDALILGAVLAVVVIWFFLRDWQSTIISGLAIPLSILPTFFVMKALGYTLNGMTLIGLTLVVGILVDDAIVDLENIHRHIDLGKSPWRAAFDATAEIGLAVIATTATIVVVFLPVSFMGGIAGMFFRSFGLTVAVAVLFSLLVARTLTPLLAAYLLPDRRHDTTKEPFYRAGYMRLLNWSLAHRWAVLASGVGIFLGSLLLIPLIPKGFMASGDTGEATVSISLPSGSGLEATDRAAQQATAILARHPEVKTVYAVIGGAGMDMRGGSTSGSDATLYVVLVPKHERSLGIEAFSQTVNQELKAIPGARVSIAQQAGVGGAAKPVSVILKGADADLLERTADQVLGQMRGLGALRDVTSTASEKRPEIQIIPDPVRAAEQGVSVATIGRVARLATQGDVAVNLPKFNAGDQQVDIRVELKDQVHQDLSAIGDLMVPGRQGLVPLRSVADIRMGQGPVSISRSDRERQVTLSANLNGKATLGAAMQEIHALPAMRALPPGISQEPAGQSKIMADIFSAFGVALATGVLLIYVVLVLLFRSFLMPLIIMGALPLAIGGAFAGLLLGGKELGMMALIGIIMLMGLVTKNSILLVEYAMMARAHGMARREALLQAGHDRLRPILMTTIAMIAGMLPIALSLGEGTERLSPMALAVIGGLVTSTLLTLVVIPTMYTFMDDAKGRLNRRMGGWIRRPPEEEAPTPPITIAPEGPQAARKERD